MEVLRDIGVSTLSNFIWVALVFGVLYVRDRKKKEQIANCQVAYITYLIKSTALVRYTVYPYIYLVELKTMQGSILQTILASLYNLTAGLLKQIQEGLTIVESRKLQEKILELYRKVVMFHTHVAESQAQADVIVGNVVELLEPPRQQEEMRVCSQFARDFPRLVREIYEIFPESVRAGVSQEILASLDQKTPLQEQYEK